MRFSEIIKLEPALVRPDEAARFLGGEGVLSRMLAANWFRPVHQASRLTLYSVDDLKAAAARLKVEALPGRER